MSYATKTHKQRSVNRSKAGLCSEDLDIYLPKQAKSRRRDLDAAAVHP